MVTRRRFCDLEGRSLAAFHKQVQRGRWDAYLVLQPGRFYPVVNYQKWQRDETRRALRLEGLKRRHDAFMEILTLPPDDYLARAGSLGLDS